MSLCALVGPLFPPPPAPCLLYVPFLCVRLSCCCFVSFFFCVRGPCCSRAPCMCPLLFSVLPRSRRPAPPLSPVSPPILLVAVDPACTSALAVCATLSLVCATRVLYPCPSPAPLPFPLGAPSVPAPHPILVAWRPVWGGGVYLWTGLWPCPKSGMAVGCLRTMSHRMRRMKTERTSGRRLTISRRCICIVEPSRIVKVRTPLHLVGVPWRRWPPRPGVVNPSGHVATFSMQHHPAMQRALPPCAKSADSPHTPAASPLGRHRDVAPLHRNRVHLHCHLPIPAISPITPLAKTLAPTCRNIGCVCPFASPASQSPGAVTHPKGTALLHAVAGRSRMEHLSRCTLMRMQASAVTLGGTNEC